MEEQRQQELLDNGDVTGDEGGLLVRPTIRSYNIVLHALSQQPPPQSTTGSKDDTAVVQRATRLFDRMPNRDVVSYTTLVATYCKLLTGKEALDAVAKVLERAWTDPVVAQASNVAAFLSNVLYSVATVDDKAMATFAEKIVTEAVSRKFATDIGVYNGLLHCWSKAAAKGNRDAGKRVLSILRQLEDDARYQPDASTYTNVLVALRGTSPDNLNVAEEILTRMENEGPKPTVQTYTALMMNYARSKLPNKAVKAAAVLERMRGRDVYPNIISYNAVLNACEHTIPSEPAATEETLRVACLVFDQARKAKNVQPNHVTYGTFLAALGNLMPLESRQEIVALVFKRCCMEGLVSGLVLRKLRNAAESEERYRDLLEGHHTDERQLPASWTCRVRENLARNEV